MSRAGFALALALALGVPALAAPRPVELPVPDLPITVNWVRLAVTRPPLELPAAPPVTPPEDEIDRAPLPRFNTALPKPRPGAADPGGFSCAFIAFRRAAALADCGVHRILTGDLKGAREALEESVAIDPRGAQAPAAQVWLGEIYLADGRFDQADRAYRAGLAANPPAGLGAHAALGIGLIALRRGQPAEAERLLDHARALMPPQAVALHVRYFQGVARLLADRPADALADWAPLPTSGASDAMQQELLFWQGVARARQDDRDGALESLDRFLGAVWSAHPLRADAITQAGWALLARGAPADAARRFAEADAAQPRADLRPQIRVGLVRAYLAAGDTAQAMAVARRLEADSPRDPSVAPALLLIADEAARRGATAEAVDALRRAAALPLEPALADYATYRLGEELERLGHRAEAKERYRALRDKGKDEAIAQRGGSRLGLLELADGDAAAARREGEALLRAGAVPVLGEPALLLAAEGAARSGDPNRAAALFRSALRAAPGSPRAGHVRVRLGWALRDDREPENALREWEAAARGNDPESAGLARLALAATALERGREAEALEALRGIGALPAGHPQADAVALDRGLLATRAGAWQEAIQVLEPLGARVGDVPRQALLRRALGIARYRVGQYDLSERQFRLAAHVAPAEPSNWLGVGLAALAQSRLAEAEDALGRARAAAAPEVASTASYALILTAVRRGDGEQFRERATAFVDRHPTHPSVPPVLHALAAAALDRGDLDGGEAWVRRLVRDGSKSPEAAAALERLAAATAASRPAVARQAYRDLLALRAPGAERAEAWLGAAEAAATLGDGKDAQQAVEGYLREAPPGDRRQAQAYVLLVRAHQAQGQRDAAIRAAEAFLARSPGDAQAPAMQLVRGQLLVEEQRWAAAQPALEAARDRGEPAVAAPAAYWLGESLRAREDHDAAVSAYLGATYLYPDSPWAARGLQGAAQSYLARNKKREAALALRKLVALPGAEPALAQWARQVLGQLGPITEPDPGAALRRGAASP